MTVVVVALCGGAALCVFALVRSILWRRRVSARPVLTVAEAERVAPGTAVVVTGRTAASPVETSPRLGRESVWYEVVRRRTRVISSNYDEHTETIERVWGDLGLYDEVDGRVAVTAELGRRAILLVVPPMVGTLASGPQTGSNSDYEQVYESFIEVDRPVVVTGVVEPGGVLGKASWLDGTAQSTVDEVFARHRRFERWMVVMSFVFVAAAAVAGA